MTIDANTMQIMATVIGFLALFWKIAKNHSSMEIKVKNQGDDLEKVKSLCTNCIMKIRVDGVEKESKRMDGEQKILRAQMPESLRMQLGQLPYQISIMNETLKNAVVKIDTIQDDVTRIKTGLANCKTLDIDLGEER